METKDSRVGALGLDRKVAKDLQFWCLELVVLTFGLEVEELGGLESGLEFGLMFFEEKIVALEPLRL